MKSSLIEYNGKKLTLTRIAINEKIKYETLKSNYEQLNDIYIAVAKTKDDKKKHNGDILYDGKMMTISGIAKLLGIKKLRLKELYEKYKNINKAIFLTKESQRARREALYKNKKTSVSEFAKYYNKSRLKIEKELDNGKTLDEIENEMNIEKKEYLMFGKTTLYQYCIEEGYNYWTIRYMIETFNIPVEDAIFEYKKLGQQIPSTWIYKKYGVLFKHLMLKYGFDSNRIIRLINHEGYTLEEALVKLVFISDSSLSSLESNWLYDLYELIKSSPNELNDIYEVFYVDENEKNILQTKDNKIEKIKRDLILYEVAEVIDIWERYELFDILTLHDISEKEIITIFTDLYKPFDAGIINPTLEHKTHIQNINDVITSSIKKNLTKEKLDKLGKEEKKFAIEKIKLIKNILEKRKEYVEDNKKKVRL